MNHNKLRVMSSWTPNNARESEAMRNMLMYEMGGSSAIAKHPDPSQFDHSRSPYKRLSSHRIK
ncbi:hypothetical protein MHO82_05750 [Vibrio sp. Of7-15]|uniref:hypothetical protein n=1 Tax=Vibrio sp. Of7-15 TaxID=2724879 RepID=UPI001EF36BE6|nr:hypothetical protein [Vibrio sp. Of7-15]MCG7496357.1 hypothetical protein [Vibrio sp. Of7-15]